MSTATTAISLREARELSDLIVQQLAPHCERVEVAGSIRRGKPFVNDIEVVCIPKTLKVVTPKIAKPADLFADQVEVTETNVMRVPGFVNLVDGWQTDSMEQMENGKKFGDPWKGKYCKFKTYTDTQVDLFMATPDNWGYIFLIRTGSADFSKMIASRWVSMGYKGEDGKLNRQGLELKWPEESDVFTALGMRTPHPSERELTADGISKWLIR